MFGWYGLRYENGLENRGKGMRNARREIDWFKRRRKHKKETDISLSLFNLWVFLDKIPLKMKKIN